MLNLIEIVDDNDLDDGSVELCFEATGPESLLSGKLYFADRNAADRFLAGRRRCTLNI